MSIIDCFEKVGIVSYVGAINVGSYEECPCGEMYTVPSWRRGGLAKTAGDYCLQSPVRERSSLSRAVNATPTISLHRERNGSS